MPLPRGMLPLPRFFLNKTDNKNSTMTLRHQQRPHLPIRAIICGILGALFFTVQDAAFKWYTAEYAVLQIIFLRCFFALLISFVWVWRDGGWRALRVQHPRLFICSLVANITAWYCFYTALVTLPLTVVICIFFLTPVVTAVASVYFLSEHLTWRQLLALLLGGIGVLVITNPFAETIPVELSAVLLILVSVLMWSAIAVITRALTSSIRVGAILFYNNASFLCVTLFFQPVVWVTPTSASDWTGMLLLGALGVFAQAFVFIAYRSARTAIAATTEYTALIWAAWLGWLLWDEQINLRVGIGVTLIIIAGVIVLYFCKSAEIKHQQLPPAPDGAQR